MVRTALLLVDKGALRNGVPAYSSYSRVLEPSNRSSESRLIAQLNTKSCSLGSCRGPVRAWCGVRRRRAGSGSSTAGATRWSTAADLPLVNLAPGSGRWLGSQDGFDTRTVAKRGQPPEGRTLLIDSVTPRAARAAHGHEAAAEAGEEACDHDHHLRRKRHHGCCGGGMGGDGSPGRCAAAVARPLA